MGNFLIVTADAGSWPGAQALFEAGLKLGRSLGMREAVSIIPQANTWAASYCRLDGSACSFTRNALSGNWVMASGAWFHKSGYGIGKEEGLLERLTEVGCDLVADELEGFFVLIFGDALKGEIVVITDIIGSCHCFLRQWPGITAISGSSLLLATLGEAKLDAIACREFLSTGVIYEGRTLHEGISKLGSASIMRIQSGRPTASRTYWQVSKLTKPLGNGEAVEGMQEALVNACHKIVAAYPQPVCDLTGGYDSRALLAAILRAEVRVPTVVAGPPHSPDVVISRALAEAEGLPNHHLNPEPVSSLSEISEGLRLTDGECDIIEYARVFKIHRMLSENFDISLNGSYGEVARAYWWELLFPHTGACTEVDAAKVARLRFAAGPYDDGLFCKEHQFDLVSHFAEVIKRTNRDLTAAPNTLQMDNIYLMMRMQRWQGRIASSTNQIWPCLSPFMFRPVLEIMIRTNPAFRRRGRFIGEYMARINPGLANYPLEHGYPPLPFTLRTAHRFWPIVPLYAGKAWRKLASRLGMARSSLAIASSARIRLWRDDAVRTILVPKGMMAAEVLDDRVLAGFLDRSKNRDFPYDGQWARILTLELLLRKVRELLPKPSRN